MRSWGVEAGARREQGVGSWLLWQQLRKTKLFSSGRGSFLALLAAEHAGGPRVHHGPRVGPGRAPWRVLWVFEVTKSGMSSRVCFPTS